MNSPVCLLEKDTAGKAGRQGGGQESCSSSRSLNSAQQVPATSWSSPVAPVQFGFPVAAVTVPAFSNHLPEFQGSHPYIQQEYQFPGAPGDPEITAANTGILLSCAPPTRAGIPLGWDVCWGCRELGAV